MADLDALFQEVLDARGDLAIRCTDPDGTLRDIKPVPLEGAASPQWVQTWGDHDNAHTLTEQAVRNRMQTSDPDVRLIPDRRSRFAVLRERE